MTPRILLVDDSQELLNAYRAFLQGTTPWEIRTAASGRAALELLPTWRPDVLVTDLIMPDMNGLELITHVRSQLAPPLPVVVAVSGFPELEQEALRRGARTFQAKPIDTDDLLALIESLLADREPPDDVRLHTEARRRMVSERARAAVSRTLAHRPHYPDAAQLGLRLLSRYFDDADAAIVLMGPERPSVFAAAGWTAGPEPAGVLGYALDVVVSGSTLIVPDLAAMPGGGPGAALAGRRLFAAVPVRAADDLAIGALALTDERLRPFDVHDLGILQHIAGRLGTVFSGEADGSAVLQDDGLLLADSWRHCLACEVRHLETGATLVLAVAALPAEPGEPVAPGVSPAQVHAMERDVRKLVERLPPRTAVGRLAPDRLAAYSLVEAPAVGERALLSVLAMLEGGPPRASIGMLSVAGVCPTDGGAALLDVVAWLLDRALARGPATTVLARLVPEASERSGTCAA